MTAVSSKINSRMLYLFVDIVIFVAFLIAMAPHLTGTPIHEWLSLSLGVGTIVHLLLNWSWIVGVTQRFFGNVTWSARINYVLNTALFIDITVIIFTGLMISQAVLPIFGVQTEHGGTWRMVHSLSADMFPILMGLHVALHWNWIFNTTLRLLGIHPKVVVATAVATTNVTPNNVTPNNVTTTTVGEVI